MCGQYFVYLHSAHFHLQCSDWLQQLAIHAYQGGLGNTGHNGSTRPETLRSYWTEPDTAMNKEAGSVSDQASYHWLIRCVISPEGSRL